MARPLTFAMAEALRNHFPLALLTLIEHPSGDAYFWTGVGSLDWNGFTWTGAGTLGTVTPVKHTNDLAIQEITFSLTGADPAIVASLDDNVRNLSGIVWLACLDEHGKVVADPYQLLDSQLDYQSSSIDDSGVATISITARSGFYTLDRALDAVWSSADQKGTYPTDSGMDMISLLQNQDVLWTHA